MPALHFGRCVLHRSARELWRDGECVDVQRQSFELLLYLMDHADQVVTRDELLAQVWGTLHVSESVVSRAVMKLRRAVGDDGRGPEIIRTLHGVGYRFVASVHQATSNRTAQLQAPATTAAQVGTGLLPLHNDTGEPQLDWAGAGLPSLIAHLAPPQAGLQVVPADQLQQADNPNLAPQERALHLRQMLGLREVVRLRLWRASSGALGLTLVCDGMQASPMTRHMEGADVAQLASQAATWLGQARMQATPQGELDPALMELLARAAHEMQQDRYRPALALLTEAVTRAPQAPSVRLQWAVALRHTGAYRDAEAQALLALERAERQSDTDLVLRCRMLQIQAAQQSGDVLRAQSLLNQGRELAQSLTTSPWPALWAMQSGVLALFLNDLRAATTELESAIANAAGTRHLLLQIRARIQLASVLVRRGLLSHAEATLERAQHLLARQRSPVLEGHVLLQFSHLQMERRQFTLAAAQARQAQAYFESAGDAYLSCLARLYVLHALLGSNKLVVAMAEAGQLLRQFEGQDPMHLPMPHADSYVRFLKLEVDWRRGKHQRSLAEQRFVLAALGQVEGLRSTLHEFQAVHAAHLIHSGELLEAQAQAQAMDPRNEASLQRLQAALLLAQGQAPEAQALLQKLWAEGDVVNGASIDSAIDLAWMCMAQSDGPDELLERLMASVEDHADEYLPAILVRARYLSRQGEEAFALAELQRGVDQGREAVLTLMRQCLSARRQGLPWPEVGGLLCDCVQD